MVSLEQGKKILFENISEWFEDNGYYHSTNGTEKFIKETENWVYSIMFNFYDNSTEHFNTTLFMHSRKVENIILQVGIPNINMESYIKRENLLNTLHDKVNLENFMKEREKISLESEKGYIEWAKLIKQYMSIGASDFLNQFNYLPNVLTAIEDIEKRGLKNYLEILVGGIDHLFRALIISKLCNDENYDKRKQRFDELILQPKYSSWHSYYKKLIDLLEKPTLICS